VHQELAAKQKTANPSGRRFFNQPWRNLFGESNSPRIEPEIFLIQGTLPLHW